MLIEILTTFPKTVKDPVTNSVLSSNRFACPCTYMNLFFCITILLSIVPKTHPSNGLSVQELDSCNCLNSLTRASAQRPFIVGSNLHVSFALDVLVLSLL